MKPYISAKQAPLFESHPMDAVEAALQRGLPSDHLSEHRQCGVYDDRHADIAMGHVVGGDDQARLLEFATELAADSGLRKDMGRRSLALADREFSSASVVSQIVARLRAPKNASPIVD